MFKYYLLTLITVLLFFHGFFPTGGNIKENSQPKPADFHSVSNLKSDFKKVVLIIIDALRYDFFTEKLMNSSFNLTKSNGCFLKIKAETPTVTLPRIKALIAGDVPQFIDVVNNLFNSEKLGDSLIHSYVKAGKNVVFYGDNTWLRIFDEKMFKRHEGTHSFFVRDFHEVDDNVTRNVKSELGRNDWDLMVLHYLGLDHIGHVHGPFSPLIPKKLHEMDGIVDEIYQNLKNQNSLIIITGDHGMRDGGGHGGATYPEIYVPLIFIGETCGNFENYNFYQTDIPVNLAMLLGVEIPLNSIGKLWSIFNTNLDKYLYYLNYNSLILRDKNRICNYDKADFYYEQFLKKSRENYASNDIQNSNNSRRNDATKAAESYDDCSRRISDDLLKNSTNQNVVLMLVALSIQILLIAKLAAKFKFDLKKFDLKDKYLFLTFVFHPIFFISSSYVEEEHQYWYYALITLLMIHFIKQFDFESLLFLMSFRFLRRLNSTGDQWSTRPDITDFFNKQENYLLMQIFFLINLTLILLTLYYLNQNKFCLLTNFFILKLIFLYKLHDNYIFARIIYLIIFINGTFVLKNNKLVSVWILMLALLLNPVNLILAPFCVFMCHFFKNYPFKCLILGNTLYFAQGHSNSLASIDVTVGYTGLQSYNNFIVILQILLHTYAFPVLCNLLCIKHYKNLFKILLLNKLYIFIIIATVNLMHRHHLFVWSVFAPKLFIETIQICFLFIQYLIYVFVNNFIKFINNYS